MSYSHSPKDTWKAILLPDLQNYTNDEANFEFLRETLNWIVTHRVEERIQMVLQVGDLTDQNQPNQWQRAKSAFEILDGKVPYALTVGNHDLGTLEIGENRSTLLNKYLSPADNPLNRNQFVAFYEDQRLENTASVFHLGSEDWLVLALEFGPRQPVVEWAHNVLSQHADKPTILLTHEYIDQLSQVSSGQVRRSYPETYNSPYNYGIAHEAGGVHCGQELWKTLVEPHSQIYLTVNGHYRPFQRDAKGNILPVPGVAEAKRTDERVDGTLVHQHFFNAQWAPNGGDGWIQILEFENAGKLIDTQPFQAVAELTTA